MMAPIATHHRAVAVFDLDGTITVRDNYVAFLLHCLRRQPQRLRSCATLPWNVLRFKLGRIDNKALKERFLAAVLAGTPRANAEAWAEEFANACVARMVKPTALARIRWHKERDHELILASASLDLYADHIGRRLGFDRSISTRVAWSDDGRIVGVLDGPNLRGEHKSAAVADMLGFAPENARRVTAYTDHHSDLPLLRLAHQPVAVDPTKRLKKLAEAHGFSIERWR